MGLPFLELGVNDTILFVWYTIKYMKPLTINLAKLLKGYKSGWIGISSDFKKVVVWGRTLKEARKIEKEKSIKERVYYFPVEKSYGNFIG